MIGVTTRLAPELRLALAVFWRYVATFAALLTGILCGHDDQCGAGRDHLLFQPSGDQAPAIAEYRPIQPGLRRGAVAQELTQIVGVGFRFRSAHHRAHRQRLNGYQLIIGGELGGDLLHPIAAPVAYPLMHTSDVGFRSLPTCTAFTLSRQPSLQSSQALALALTHDRGAQHLTIRSCDRRRNTTIDSHRPTTAPRIRNPWLRAGKTDMPAIAPVAGNPRHAQRARRKPT
jgi:hypothetical protein